MRCSPSIILLCALLYAFYCHARRERYDRDSVDLSRRRPQSRRSAFAKPRIGARTYHRPDNASVVFHYFPLLSSRQKKQINQLGELYYRWNQKMNLISRKDIANLYLHHVLHSLAISRVVSFASGSRILDFGSGGGFPGIPLAILYPDVFFHLVDSVAKKVRVMEEIVSTLGLKNANCTQSRGEDIDEKYDFILGRAVVRLPFMYDYVKDKFAVERKNNFSNGLLYLTGKSEERAPCTVEWYSLGTYFKEPYFSEKYLAHAYPANAVIEEVNNTDSTNNGNATQSNPEERERLTELQVVKTSNATESNPEELQRSTELQVDDVRLKSSNATQSNPEERERSTELQVLKTTNATQSNPEERERSTELQVLKTTNATQSNPEERQRSTELQVDDVRLKSSNATQSNPEECERSTELQADAVQLKSNDSAA